MITSSLTKQPLLGALTKQTQSDSCTEQPLSNSSVNNQSQASSLTKQAQPNSIQTNWIERGKKVMMQTYATQPIVLTEGRGSYVQDVSGKKYLDFASGIAVNALGHCDSDYIEAVTQQLQLFSHCSNLYYNMPAIELAEKLVENSPFHQAFFCNSGAEAIEGAIKLSRKYAKANKGQSLLYHLVHEQCIPWPHIRCLVCHVPDKIP